LPENPMKCTGVSGVFFVSTGEMGETVVNELLNHSEMPLILTKRASHKIVFIYSPGFVMGIF
jgi:hypothetical protein